MTITCTKTEWETLLPEGNTGEFTVKIHTMLTKSPSNNRYQLAKAGDRLRFEIDVTEGRSKESAQDNRCSICDRPKADCACVENGGTYYVQNHYQHFPTV